MADVDIVMDIGMGGDSSVKGYTGKVALTTAAWSFTRPLKLQSGQSTDRSNGAPSASEIYVTKSRDSASGKMLAALMKGTVITTDVKIYYLITDGGTIKPWRTLTLTNVILSQYNTTTGNSGQTEEHYTLSPTKLAVIDQTTGATGTAGTQTPLTYDYSSQDTQA